MSYVLNFTRMKTKNLLRFFIILSFFIFYLPFLDTCAGKREKTTSPATESNEEIKELPKDTTNVKVVKTVYDDALKISKEVKEDSVNVEVIDELSKDTSNINDVEAPYNKEIENKEKSNSNDVIYNEDTQNLYELSYPLIEIFKEFEIIVFKEFAFYLYIIFALIIIFTLIMLVLSFKNKYKTIFWLNILNIVFLLFNYISLYVMEIIEYINQIKYGTVLFLINCIIIFALSLKLKSERN